MPRSYELFDLEHKAKDKYVYFICGVTGALFAYIGRDYKPNSPLTTQDIMTISSLGCLSASFLMGLFRILFYVQAMNVNRAAHHSAEELLSITDALTEHVKNPNTVTLQTESIEPFNKEKLEKRKAHLIEKKAKDDVLTTRWEFCSATALVLCHVFLIGGFALLVISKIFPVKT